MLRIVFILSGMAILLLGIFLPQGIILNKAISPALQKQIITQSGQARLDELLIQFGQGLKYFRLAIALLGIWITTLALLWRRIRQAGDESKPPDTSGIDLKEIKYPLSWMVAVFLLSIPLLGKGFEHSEFLNYEMLAQRGPAVTAVCQNLPPRAAQPAFTIVESIVLKVFGGEEITARIPAVFFAALSLIPLYFTARRFGPVKFANLVCLALSLNGFFLFYASYARGYSLALCAYAFCVWLAVLLLDASTWRNWILYSLAMTVSVYAHLSSALYLLLLTLVLVAGILTGRKNRDGQSINLVKVLIKPAVVCISAGSILFVLYSFGIPTELKYMKTFDLTDYYMSYHINKRFIMVMAETSAQIRVHYIALIQAVVSVAGLVLAFRKCRGYVLLIVIPGLVAAVLIFSRGLFVYPRFFYHFTPFYILFGVFFLWWALGRIQKCLAFSLIMVLLLTAGFFSVQRLYAMERCGARSAVRDFLKDRKNEKQLMAVLDSYVTVRHYYKPVINGGSVQKFWGGINSENRPEYVICVPYIDYDIPGGKQGLEKHYELFRSYPGWLDVDDDQDSVYLYRLKK